MTSLQGKVAIITGSSSGIGAATAVHFAGLGAKVVVTGRKEEKLKGVAKRCQEAGLAEDEVLIILGDIADGEVRKNLVDKTLEKFNQLDILVNNAGMPNSGFLSEITEEQFDRVINVNLKSAIMLSQLAIPHLIKTKGCIINVSSCLSVMPIPHVGAYGIAKAGLDLATQTLALELGPKGVRVNSVNPGIIVTDITFNAGCSQEQADGYHATESRRNPMNRNGTSEEVAHAIAFLADDRAGFICGDKLFVSGGRHLVTGPYAGFPGIEKINTEAASSSD